MTTPADRDLELERRLTRIETKQDTILDQLRNMPISPLMRKELDEIHKRIDAHDTFRDNLNQKVAWITGAFAAVLYGLSYAAKYVYNLFVSAG